MDDNKRLTMAITGVIFKAVKDLPDDVRVELLTKGKINKDTRFVEIQIHNGKGND